MRLGAPESCQLLGWHRWAPGRVPRRTTAGGARWKARSRVVRRFCKAWSDNLGAAELAAFFTDDAVYHNIPLAPVTGREAIAKNIASFIRPGAPGIEGIQFHVIHIAANGPSRHDRAGGRLQAPRQIVRVCR